MMEDDDDQGLLRDEGEEDSSDPFYTVRAELRGKLGDRGAHRDARGAARRLRHRDQRRVQGPAQGARARDARAADAQLKDLRLTVDYVERDRATLSHIDDGELARRRAFLAETKRSLDGVKTMISGDKTRRKLEADERRAFAGQQGSDLLGAKNSSQMENTRFIHDQQRQTQMTMREQDDMLEELDGAVDRTHNMAITIQDQLKDQRNMLDSLESDLEETSDKMQFAMSKLQKLLKTKDSCQIWTIVALVIVLLVLVFLAICARRRGGDRYVMPSEGRQRGSEARKRRRGSVVC